MSNKAQVRDEECPPSLNEPQTGTVVQPTGHFVSGLGGTLPGMIVSAEMCFFCFDVLLSHLNRTNLPETPPFTDGSL